jgi:hypothetical protein
MPFNIQGFKENLNSYGYLDNNSFDVIIKTPNILQNKVLNNQGTDSDIQRIAKNLKLRVEQVRAPGINLMTSQIQRYGIGSVQNMPINAQFQDINMTLLMDHYGEIWQYWYNWLNLIFGFNGLESANGPTSNSFPNYQAEYKDNYSTVMQIIVYDHFGNSIQKINLYEAFPVAMREMPLSWGDGSLMRLNLSISYTSYALVGSSVQPQPAPQPQRPFRSIRNTTTIRPGVN